MKRAAFQSLVAKLREPAMRLLSTDTVGPDAAGRGEREPDGVGAELRDRFERIDHVAARLGHLLAADADEPVQVHHGEGARPVKCSPAMIMRATQKKRMS